MFKPKGPVANQLSTQAVPNTLSWPSADAGAPAPESGVTYDLDLAQAGAPEGPEEAPSGAPEDEAESADEPEAHTPAELRAELDREAEESEKSEESEPTDIDPVERYGPYGDDVEAVMVALDDIRFEDISSDDLRRLEDSWKSVDPEAAAAVVAAVESFRTGGMYVEFLETAESDVGAWQSTRLTTGKDAELDRVVVEAARDAVDALILQDEFDDGEFDLLYGPWAEVIDPIEEKGFPAGASEEADGTVSDVEAKPDEGFGPNAEQVRAFLVTLSELCGDDFKDLTAAFNRQPKDELKMAHDAVHDLVDTDRIQRDRVVAAQEWVTGYLRPTLDLMTRRVTDRLLMDRAIALPPAIDAVTALVLGDLLAPEDAQTLLAPWAEVMEEAELDEDEGEGDDEG